MPSPTRSIEMSIDEFETMPHRIGWKHEYWDSHARLSPSPTAIATFERTIWESSEAADDAKISNGAIRLPVESDLHELIRLQTEVFEDAVEYVGHDEKSYRRSIDQDIRSFFGDGPDHSIGKGCLNYSRVVEHQCKLIAALLVRQARDEKLVLQPIMVASDHHRRGLGRAMLQATCVSLAADQVSCLRSHCHLGNRVSIQWHQSLGFHEHPTLSAAGHRSHHHAWMADHHEANGRELEARYHRELHEAHAQIKRLCERERRISTTDQ